MKHDAHHHLTVPCYGLQEIKFTLTSSPAHPISTPSGKGWFYHTIYKRLAISFIRLGTYPSHYHQPHLALEFILPARRLDEGWDEEAGGLSPRGMEVRLRRQMKQGLLDEESANGGGSWPHLAHHSRAFSSDISSVGNRGSLYLSTFHSIKDPSTSPLRSRSFSDLPSSPTSSSSIAPTGSGKNLPCPVPCANLTRQDAKSVTLLLILYTLQGVPMGLSSSIPLLLSDK